ncbi:uncharacterized protein LOC130898859 [Diorhabda carinulata]|uniref:uncharacterized protein LOC130898859 n=1 Tax=Diorhabda carinulata TaxID=1163345 RepID=UPI0025A1CBB1|nr:uncharacterized protein LOC130898859 [Diorhabda carinulata]
MVWKMTVMAVLAFATISSAIPLTTFGKSSSRDDYEPVQKPAQQQEETDSYQLYQTQLPTALELPKQDAKQTQFYVPEPVNVLKAPQESQEPNYYQVPIPSEELVAPIDTEWNPNGDPMYYYQVPAVISRQELPTKEFPKKYNEDIHDKKKPYSSKPKLEVIFEPISAKEYEDKQIQLTKNFDQLAKKENQKLIKVVPYPKIIAPRTKMQTTDSTPKYTDSIIKPALIVPHHTYQSTPTTTTTSSVNEPSDSITVPSDHVERSTAEFNTGLSGQLINSLGIPSSASTHEGASPGERLEFHISGHDGPLSYKWGYDTGKGHNRLFRYEEKDKEGIVRGHYGFYDEEGKLQVVHYDAHPHTGFHVADKI